MFEKETTAKNTFVKPEAKVIIFDCEDIITTSETGKPVNYSNDDDKWNTPKINGSN